MKQQYGYFSNDTREYVITSPTTPVKWTNYLGTIDFGGLIDNTGGALLCAGDPSLNRISKYIPQLPDTDFKGTTLYLRVKSTTGYEVYSPFFVPCLNKMEKFECRVGLSYQKFVTQVAGIEVKATIFVPTNSCLEVRDITVTNHRNEAVEVDLIPVIEYSHFEALKQFTNADWVPQTMTSEAIKEDNGLLTLLQYAFMRRDSKVNFFTSNKPVSSFESDRKNFLGCDGLGTWANPKALQEDELSNYEALRGDNIGALLIKLGKLDPEASERAVILTGQALREEYADCVREFRSLDRVHRAFKEQAQYWDKYLSNYQCTTPDPEFDAMVNVHNPRQCQTTFNWSRYLSLYQLGLGARGLGFRDSSQDIMGVLASIPHEAKNLLRKLLYTQREDGSAMHQFYPASMEANEGDSREEGHKTTYGDDHLWAVLSVCAYLRETGDYAFLDEEITYYDKKLPVEMRSKGSVMDHLTRALEYTKNNVGQHGIPLLGFADWNDTVNLPGDAESLMVASLYGAGLLEFIELQKHLGNFDLVEKYQQDHEDIKTVVNEQGWDGEWYRRYYTEDGEPIGSKQNSHGKIYTNAQSWPVIAGFCTRERAHIALDSVEEHLNTKYGIKLSTPGYDGFDPKLGGVSTYPPGAKENGGIFLHSNPWVMIANTKIGNGDRAYKYFCQINPATKNEDIDGYQVEPYCFAQNILGDEHPQFGLGRNSWLSGTSSWTYQAATQYILGVRPTHHGLEVNPCLPSTWDKCQVTRHFRGATYHISIHNCKKDDSSKQTILVDGTKLEGSILPFAKAGTEVTVQVYLGQAVAEALPA
ncbi:cellobiose phosphorylase [Rubritalea squalenifaciens DSM 18772]|uniref:Cellobiose phosphorylase n=1 Tax=Rubritalea squalenifaciens DSM 18772 TaxID=1123071 RepID=A0A1M6ISI8_9BACT|nr:glycosyl transferase [Rubritalea squalenifaciens]SHJ37404.1 cellobiose phosphorylase [Rubritalea squalenifaciens DSM 18772]